MKKLQQFFASIILIGLLSIFAFAGDGIMTTGKTDPPPPPPTSVTATNNSAEDEGIITIWRTATDSVTEVALNVLPSVLALF